MSGAGSATLLSNITFFKNVFLLSVRILPVLSPAEGGGEEEVRGCWGGRHRREDCQAQGDRRRGRRRGIPTISFYCFGIDLEKLQWLSGSDCYVFLRQLGVKNINFYWERASMKLMKAVLGFCSSGKYLFNIISPYYPKCYRGSIQYNKVQTSKEVWTSFFLSYFFWIGAASQMYHNVLQILAPKIGSTSSKKTPNYAPWSSTFVSIFIFFCFRIHSFWHRQFVYWLLILPFIAFIPGTYFWSMFCCSWDSGSQNLNNSFMLMRITNLFWKTDKLFSWSSAMLSTQNTIKFPPMLTFYSKTY